MVFSHASVVGFRAKYAIILKIKKSILKAARLIKKTLVCFVIKSGSSVRLVQLFLAFYGTSRLVRVPIGMFSYCSKNFITIFGQNDCGYPGFWSVSCGSDTRCEITSCTSAMNRIYPLYKFVENFYKLPSPLKTVHFLVSELQNSGLVLRKVVELHVISLTAVNHKKLHFSCMYHLIMNKLKINVIIKFRTVVSKKTFNVEMHAILKLIKMFAL